MRSLKETSKINLTTWETVSCFKRWLFTTWMKSKVSFWLYFNIMWNMVDIFLERFCLLNVESSLHLSLNTEASKKNSRKSHGLGKRLLYFKIIITAETYLWIQVIESVFFFIFLMLPKYIHVGWKFRWILKSSIFQFVACSVVLNTFHPCCLRPFKWVEKYKISPTETLELFNFVLKMDRTNVFMSCYILQISLNHKKFKKEKISHFSVEALYICPILIFFHEIVSICLR